MDDSGPGVVGRIGQVIEETPAWTRPTAWCTSRGAAGPVRR